MASFFKTFFLGILYVILLPFLLAILAIGFVYCVLIFIYTAIRSVIIFFAGGSPLGDLKEDIEAKRIIENRKQAQLNPVPNYAFPQQNYPQYEQPQNILEEPSYPSFNNENTPTNDDAIRPTFKEDDDLPSIEENNEQSSLEDNNSNNGGENL